MLDPGSIPGTSTKCDHEMVADIQCNRAVDVLRIFSLHRRLDTDLQLGLGIRFRILRSQDIQRDL